jgi:hypothetical protein
MMSEETFEEEASIDDGDLDEDALDGDDLDAEEADLDPDAELDDLAIEGEIDADVVVADETVASVVEAPPAPPAPPAAAPKGDDDDDDVLDLDEELHPDDVEVPLDALLKEKTAAQKMEDEEEELEDDEPESDASADGPTRVVPRRVGEFLCSSCFLVLPRNQLADEERMLCRDCA